MALLLDPSRRRTELANGLRRDVNVLIEVAESLGLRAPRDRPAADTRTGDQVRSDLHNRLAACLEAAPQRGLGARRARFIRHVQSVTKRYDAGLFACYNQPDLPATSNAIERLHGRVKRHLRKCSGRRSTAGGVARTLGEWLPGAIVLLTTTATTALSTLVRPLTPARYREARAEQAALSAPARRYRSIQRNPPAFLDALTASWRRQPGEIG